MKRELLIFGANGALGKGVTKSLQKNNFDKIWLFDFKIDETLKDDERSKQVLISDLSEERNVTEAFKDISPGEEKRFFLFSTVGGFFGGKDLWETDVEDWDKMFKMNLKTNFLIAKHFSNLVSKSHSGSICFTAAYTAISPEKQKAAYGASKAALAHLVETLSKEGEEINLSVNAIAPYIIDTPANRGWMKDADYEKWMKPEELGNFIGDLFTNYNFISGNIFKFKNRFAV